MKVLINQDIWNKAREIIESKNHLKRYLWACEEARICPKCGEAVRGYPNPTDLYSQNICTKCDWREDAI